MKTAISIPDTVFESAEQLARRLGQSRSQLYATALRNYLEIHRDTKVGEALDRIYGETDSGLDPSLQRLQAKSLPREEW